MSKAIKKLHILFTTHRRDGRLVACIESFCGFFGSVFIIPFNALTSMHFNSRASGELFLTVSNIVTSDNRVVTRSTIRPGTISGTTTKLPHEMHTKSVEGK